MRHALDVHITNMLISSSTVKPSRHLLNEQIPTIEFNAGGGGRVVTGGDGVRAAHWQPCCFCTRRQGEGAQQQYNLGIQHFSFEVLPVI